MFSDRTNRTIDKSKMINSHRSRCSSATSKKNFSLKTDGRSAYTAQYYYAYGGQNRSKEQVQKPQTNQNTRYNQN